jgi:hypothetical protein
MASEQVEIPVSVVENVRQRVAAEALPTVQAVVYDIARSDEARMGILRVLGPPAEPDGRVLTLKGQQVLMFCYRVPPGQRYDAQAQYAKIRPLFDGEPQFDRFKKLVVASFISQIIMGYAAVVRRHSKDILDALGLPADTPVKNIAELTMDPVEGTLHLPGNLSPGRAGLFFELLAPGQVQMRPGSAN